MPSVTSRKEARPSLKLTLGSGPVPLAGSAHGTNEVRTLGVGPVLTENENVFYKLKPELLFKKNFFFFAFAQSKFLSFGHGPSCHKCECTPPVPGMAQGGVAEGRPSLLIPGKAPGPRPPGAGY